MSNQLTPVFYGDVEVRYDSGGFISLTDMWLAAGKPDGKHDPRRWKDKAGKEFIEFLATKLNVSSGDIYKTAKGRYGGTWAHWQIALAYAKYLSPAFHAWANQVIKERIEEDACPELGISRSRARAMASWRRQGKSEAFIQARLAGIDTRNHFTDTLDDHGVAGADFGICTNNIYKPILGGKATEVRHKRGLPPKANLREHMSVVELAGTQFAEALAADKIEREGRQGLNPCASACLTSGLQIRESIARHEQSIQQPRPKTSQPSLDSASPLSRKLEAVRNRGRNE